MSNLGHIMMTAPELVMWFVQGVAENFVLPQAMTTPSMQCRYHMLHGYPQAIGHHVELMRSTVIDPAFNGGPNSFGYMKRIVSNGTVKFIKIQTYFQNEDGDYVSKFEAMQRARVDAKIWLESVTEKKHLMWKTPKWPR